MDLKGGSSTRMIGAAAVNRVFNSAIQSDRRIVVAGYARLATNGSARSVRT
jgi:hypothetical protein